MSTSILSHKSGAYISRASESGKMDAGSRNLKVQCDQLYKERERERVREDKLQKEMQTMRTSYADMQRELRLASLSLDNLKSTKQEQQDEVTVYRQKNAELVRKINSIRDPQGLIDQISRDKKKEQILNENITNLKGELSLREKKMVALQQELEIAHQSLDVQSRYEQRMDPRSSAASSREIMRTLYFDMGRKQADLHSVTVELAETTQEVERIRLKLREAVEVKESTFLENDKLKKNVAYLNRQSIEYNDEITRLGNESQQRDRLCIQLQQKLEDLANRSAKEQISHEEYATESVKRIADISASEESLEMERDLLQKQFANLRETASRQGQRHQQLEAKQGEELAEALADKEQLAARVRVMEPLQTEMEILKAKMFDTEQANEQNAQRIAQLVEQARQAEATLGDAGSTSRVLERDCAALHLELERTRDRAQAVGAERDEALEALRATMRATRDLSQKYHAEREAREAAERLNEQLLQAKANLNTATLDALYQERKKSAALEKSLALVPLVLKWRSSALPPTSYGGVAIQPAGGNTAGATSSSNSSGSGASSTSSAPPIPAPTPAGSDSEALLMAGRDLNYLYSHAPGMQLAGELVPAELQHDVNATFEWLLNAEEERQRHMRQTQQLGRGGGAAIDVEVASVVLGKSDSFPAARLTPVKAVYPAPLANYSPCSPPTAPNVLHTPTGSTRVSSRTALGETSATKASEALEGGTSPGTVDSALSMVEELKRLRDELRMIEERAPQNDSAFNSSSSTLQRTPADKSK